MFGSSKEDKEKAKLAKEEELRKAKEQEQIRKEQINKIVVTTGDLKRDYEIIGPIFFQVSSKAGHFNDMAKKHDEELNELKQQGQLGGKARTDWGFLYGEYSVGQHNFDKAFFIGVKELKTKAHLIGADAIVGMRQDIDIDATGYHHFYLQMYGTAVKFK